MKKTLLIFSLMMLVGCGGEVTLDTSSNESFKASMEKMVQSLSEEKQREVQKAIPMVTIKHFTNELKAGRLPILDESKAHIPFKDLHGMNAEQVIAHGQKIKEDMGPIGDVLGNSPDMENMGVGEMAAMSMMSQQMSNMPEGANPAQMKDAFSDMQKQMEQMKTKESAK